MMILQPDRYLLPDYKISPFTTRDMECNAALRDDGFADNWFRQRFADRTYAYTRNGREAINLALQSFNLPPDALVTVLTSSQNTYLSSCVSSEVARFCRWNRELQADTAVVMVVHEFGVPFTAWHWLDDFDGPVIEDCAYSFYSTVNGRYTGERGDFAIFSLPKMFPLQVGGLIVSNSGRTWGRETISAPEVTYQKCVMSHYLRQSEQIVESRARNYHRLREQLAGFGLTERFALAEGVVPGVFMFNAPGLDLPRMREHVTAHGIQCSVFYGEQAFFIPVHQALTGFDIDYFCAVIGAFVENAAA